MKKLILCVLFPLLLNSAPTQVTGPVVTPLGAPATGTAVITLSRACLQAGGATVVNAPITVNIASGTLTVDLEPNDTCQPLGTFYRVEFRLVGYTYRFENWIVPTSASPVSIASVRTSAAVGQTLPSVGLSSITGGLTRGDLVVYDGAIFRRLGAGTNGHVLTADSTQTNGVRWSAIAGGGGGGGSVTGGACPSGQYTISTDTQAVPTCSIVNWSQLGGVPSTFTPATHSHAGGDITSGTVAAARLGSGTPSSSNFLRGDGQWIAVPYASLTGIPSSFTPSAHTHGAADTTSGVFSTARLGTGTPGATNFLRGDGSFTQVDYSLLTGVPATFTPSSHNHAATDITSGLLAAVRLAPSPAGDGSTCLKDNQTWGTCGGVGSGESNTASNLAGGIGLFGSKVGVDLRFKSLLAASNRLSVTANGSGNTVDIDLVPANVTITSLGGWPAAVDTTELGHLDGVTSGIQSQINSKASVVRTSVSFSATPTFTRTGQVQQWVMTLTGNVTSSSTSGLASGDVLIFELCQDATGNRTFAWPTGFGKAATIVPTASACSVQAFTWDGSAADPIAGMISDESGVVVRGSVISALGTPASGSVCWLDSTNGAWACKDSSGNTTTMARVESSATANQFVTHIPASGIPAKAQPSFSNLSGAATDAQIPNLNTLSTGLTGSRCVETDSGGLLISTAGPCGGGGGGGTVTSVDASGGTQTASGSAITTSGTIRASRLANAQTGTTYTVVTADRGKSLTFSNASSIAVTLPQAGGTDFPDGWFTHVKNIGAGTVTITPTTSTIDGAASLALGTGEFAMIRSDGTNYEAESDRLVAGTNITLTKGRSGTTIEASGGGGGGGCTVVGAAGNYAIPGAPGPLTLDGYSNSNAMQPNGGAGANQQALWHIYMPCAFTPNSISINVTTAGGAGCRLSVGMYDDSKNLIISSGVLEDSATTIQCDVAGVKTLTSSTSPAATGLGTTRPAGWYWVASTSNETTSRISGLWAAGNAISMLGGLGGGQFGVLSGAQATTNGALRSSWTTGSGWTQTVVWIPVVVLVN